MLNFDALKYALYTDSCSLLFQLDFSLLTSRYYFIKVVQCFLSIDEHKHHIPWFSAEGPNRMAGTHKPFGYQRQSQLGCTAATRVMSGERKPLQLIVWGLIGETLGHGAEQSSHKADEEKAEEKQGSRRVGAKPNKRGAKERSRSMWEVDSIGECIVGWLTDE